MLLAVLLNVLSLLAVARAAQPSAPSPVPAPLRELPWGQLNFLHTTDTHGWHAGHLQEPSYSADWGDYISLAQRLREKAEREGRDLLLVDTGDRVEGNGLYDASKPQGNYTRDIFKNQHIDVICSGNHELYKEHTAENELLEMVPAYKDNYLASNLDIIDPKSGEKVPLARRFKKFTTKVQGLRILAFGFLFDFTGNYNNTIIQPVEETIKEEWFQEAIRDREVDLVLVAGHVHIRSPEAINIYRAIRDVQWDVPIMFFGGHFHIRDYIKYDSNAYGLESGRYMETIGFESISGFETRKNRKDTVQVTKNKSFSRRYIDNNLFSFHHHTGLDGVSFPTEHGKNVSALITSARKELDLDSRFGCAPRDLWMNRAPYPSESSIFTWLEEQVVPDMVVDPERASKPRIVLSNTGAMRFDIFKGAFTKDTTYIVSPFTSGFRYIADVPFDIAERLATVLNNGNSLLDHSFPELRSQMLGPPEQLGMKMDSGNAHTPRMLQNQQRVFTSATPDLTPGYTTLDDAGEDGDDTIHSPITFYRVPNCIESRVNTTKNGTEASDMLVETVDVVFVEFIQPWVIAGLKFLGGAYSVEETSEYLPGRSFTELIAEWIQENWTGDC